MPTPNRQPDVLIQELLEALPQQWGYSPDYTPADPSAEWYELDMRERARDTRPQAVHLRPGEKIVHDWRLAFSRDQDGRSIDGAIIGVLRSPGGARQLFVHYRNVDAGPAGLFRRWAEHAPAHGIAHWLQQTARATDIELIERALTEERKDPSLGKNWFPGPSVLVLDTETTGLSTDQNRVVEVAWLLADHAPRQWRSHLINPGLPMPADTYTVNGIDDSLVHAEGSDPAKTLDDTLDAIAEHLRDGAVLVVANTEFDLPLLDAECRRYSLRPLAARVGVEHLKAVDPIRLHQKLFGARKGHSTLPALAERYVPGGALGSHTALGDCHATFHVLAALLRQEGEKIARRSILDDTHRRTTGAQAPESRPRPALHDLLALSSY
ncbi:exonuclease domain-containing protein [Streptomyces sp. NPDC057565]|uniref:3'-5' exonuclease n=1 Tax=Streptomyces sp. NPDC057565 TaxID=3346169 RepID=UPI0036880405